MASGASTLPLLVRAFPFFYSFLPPWEARSLRLCCKDLAHIGACHCFKEIVFHLYKPDFERLRALADHPIISNHITALFYEAGSLVINGVNPYLDVNPEPAEAYLDEDEYRFETKDIGNRRRVHNCEENWLPRGAFDNLPITKEDLEGNYNQYLRAVDHQAQILWNREDYRLFEEVLPKLKGLEEIVVNHSIPVHPSPYDCFFAQPGSEMGAKQLQAVVHGLQGSELQLRSLCSRLIPPTLINARLFNQIARSCKGLTSLSLDFASEDYTDYSDEIHIHTEHTRRMIDTQIIQDCLKELLSLEYLSITFEAPRKLYFLSSLRGLIAPGFIWKNLREIQLSFIETEREELFNFFELHRSTLKVIRLHHCKLTTTSWVKLLWQMKGALDLNDICISGRVMGRLESGESYPDLKQLYDNYGYQIWWFGSPDNPAKSSVTAGITAWFLHDAPFPLVSGIQYDTASDDEPDDDSEGERP
ncbi:hypothetical protein M434DRAFT_11514 [Hypoxylon sp. CO27-5]|nr:hypothetical protein M434DRAFT_11514 [Hypoxylon sp. CO27-5]